MAKVPPTAPKHNCATTPVNLPLSPTQRQSLSLPAIRNALRVRERVYAEHFGITAEACIGKPISEVIGQRAYDSIHSYVERVLSGVAVQCPRASRLVRSVGAERQSGCERPGGGSLSILIVDDNADAALTLAMLLKAVGRALAVAHDGLGSLQIASDIRPNVVFLDIGSLWARWPRSFKQLA